MSVCLYVVYVFFAIYPEAVQHSWMLRYYDEPHRKCHKGVQVDCIPVFTAFSLHIQLSYRGGLPLLCYLLLKFGMNTRKNHVEGSGKRSRSPIQACPNFILQPLLFLIGLLQSQLPYDFHSQPKTLDPHSTLVKPLQTRLYHGRIACRSWVLLLLATHVAAVSEARADIATHYCKQTIITMWQHYALGYIRPI